MFSSMVETGKTPLTVYAGHPQPWYLVPLAEKHKI